mgnify:FL=1
MINNKIIPNGRFSYDGYENGLIGFAENMQLLCEDTWELIAHQFEGYADAHDLGWRGEYWGKLMRSGSMVYMYSKNEKLYDVLCKYVKKLLKTGGEREAITSYSPLTEFNGWDMWSRKYVLLGFYYFSLICKDEELKKEITGCMKKQLDYIISKIGENGIDITETSDFWQGVNSSSILEPAVKLYFMTDDKKYLDFAKYIVERGAAKEFNLFEYALEDKMNPCEYPVTKGYEMMSCFEGLIEYYRATGIEKYKTAAIKFADRIINSEITIIGAAGCKHECFNHSSVMQFNPEYNGLMQETCVTVTWMKLCAKLYSLTGDIKYMHQIERSSYNAMHGAVNTEGRTCNPKATFDFEFFKDVYAIYTSRRTHINGGGQAFDSYSPVMLGERGCAVGGFRPMEDNTKYSGCCIVISGAGLALPMIYSAVSFDNAAVFNFYMNGSGELNINGRNVGFEIETKYPTDGAVKITLKDSFSGEIRLRIPEFSLNTRVVCGGKEYSPNAGEYFTVSGDWKKGDVILLDIDMNPRVIDSGADYFAVMYGPLVLARDARISKVGEPVKMKNLTAEIKKIDSGSINCRCLFDVKVGDSSFKMMDYASAGKTWNEASAFEAWIRKEMI